MVVQPSLHGLFALRFSLPGIICVSKDSKEKCRKDLTMILATIPCRLEICRMAWRVSQVADDWTLSNRQILMRRWGTQPKAELPGWKCRKYLHFLYHSTKTARAASGIAWYQSKAPSCSSQSCSSHSPISIRKDTSPFFQFFTSCVRRKWCSDRSRECFSRRAWYSSWNGCSTSIHEFDATCILKAATRVHVYPSTNDSSVGRSSG